MRALAGRDANLFTDAQKLQFNPLVGSGKKAQEISPPLDSTTFDFSEVISSHEWILSHLSRPLIVEEREGLKAKRIF